MYSPLKPEDTPSPSPARDAHPEPRGPSYCPLGDYPIPPGIPTPSTRYPMVAKNP